MSSRYKHNDPKSIQEQRAHRTEHASFMSLSTTCRVQVCPAAVLAAVAAGANEEAREQIPALLLAELAATTRGPTDECPTEATARLERWLCETRGCEMRKSKTLDAALRAVAHVAYVWQRPGTSDDDSAEVVDSDHLANATRRPRMPAPVFHERVLVLPRASPATLVGRLIGRGGHRVRPLLERCPGVRLFFEDNAVRIIASAACVSDDVLQHFQSKVASILQRHALSLHTYVLASRVEPAADLSENLEQEREYRERNLRRKSDNKKAERKDAVTRSKKKGERESRGSVKHGTRRREKKPRLTAKCKAFSLSNALHDFPFSSAFPRAHRTKNASIMSRATTCRVQVCPAAVLVNSRQKMG